MSQKQQHYEQEFKNKIVRLHIEEGRTYKSLTAEYGVSKASISKWCSELSEECHVPPLAYPVLENLLLLGRLLAFKVHEAGVLLVEPLLVRL